MSVFEEIEKSKKVNKHQILELIENAKEETISFSTKWINSDDKKLQVVATSIIDEYGDFYPEDCVIFYERLLKLVQSKTNRLVWGSLTALETFAQLIPEKFHKNLNIIIDAANNGSVVAKDHAVKIYQKLARFEEYYSDALELILEQIRVCADNQLGQYSERCLEIIKPKDKLQFIESLRLRVASLENNHHIRRINTILEKAHKLK